MICNVKYVSWKKLEVPDEIIERQSKDDIRQFIYNSFPDCLLVEAVCDENGNEITKNW